MQSAALLRRLPSVASSVVSATLGEFAEDLPKKGKDRGVAGVAMISVAAIAAANKEKRLEELQQEEQESEPSESGSFCSINWDMVFCCHICAAEALGRQDDYFPSCEKYATLEDWFANLIAYHCGKCGDVFHAECRPPHYTSLEAAQNPPAYPDGFTCDVCWGEAPSPMLKLEPEPEPEPEPEVAGSAGSSSFF